MFDRHAPTHTVLIVDDEYVPRSLESIALEGTGRYYTLSTGNAVDALEALSQSECHAAIVDFEMPDMTGLELIEHIRRSRGNGDLKVVLVMPEGTSAAELAAAYAGVDRVIGKPIDPWSLVRELDELTGATDNSDEVLSIESLLKGFPYPTMILDSEHNVVLANGEFYKQTGTGIGSCYVHCMEEMHDDHAVPGNCPLEESVRTGRSVERDVRTVMGDMRVSVYPLPTRAGGKDRLFLHVTMPV